MGSSYSAVARNRRRIALPKESVECVRHVSSGHFGDVYYGRVELSADDKFDAAIKVSKKSSKDAYDRAVFEVEVMRRLKHPNVVRFYGVLQDDAKLQIVLEWCTHGSLSSRLHKVPRLGVSHKVRALADVASGMRYLSGADGPPGGLAVVHNDLAARNCLVDRRGVAKVSDFGLAVVLPVRESPAELSKRLSTLPVRWAAPELLAATVDQLGPSLSVQADIWSFGVLIWEVCNDGAKPWGRALGNKEVKQLVIRDNITLLEKMPLPPPKKSVTKMYANAKPSPEDGVYEELARLADHCMRFTPAERLGWHRIVSALNETMMMLNQGQNDSMSEP